MHGRAFYFHNENGFKPFLSKRKRIVHIVAGPWGFVALCRVWRGDDPGLCHRIAWGPGLVFLFARFCTMPSQLTMEIPRLPPGWWLKMDWTGAVPSAVRCAVGPASPHGVPDNEVLGLLSVSTWRFFVPTPNPGSCRRCAAWRWCGWSAAVFRPTCAVPCGMARPPRLSDVYLQLFLR